MPFGRLYVFFGKMSIQVFCPFFGFFDVELYILDINPLLVKSFANIFVFIHINEFNTHKTL